MRTESILLSMLLFLLAAFLLIVGGGCLTLHSLAPHVLSQVLSFIESHVQWFSIGCIGFSLALCLLCALWCRHGYLIMEMGGVTLRDTAIAQLTRQCLSSYFPGEKPDCDVVVKQGNQLEIFAQLPMLELEAQEQSLREIEQKLSRLLADQCGFYRPFVFHARFKNN